jgi:hypothetical protein
MVIDARKLDGYVDILARREDWNWYLKDLNCSPEVLLEILELEPDTFRVEIYLHPNLPLYKIKEIFNKDIKGIDDKTIEGNSIFLNNKTEYFEKSIKALEAKAIFENSSLTPSLIEYFFRHTVNSIEKLLEHPKCPRYIIDAYIFDEVLPSHERDDNRLSITRREYLTQGEAYWLKESCNLLGLPNSSYLDTMEGLLGRVNPFLNLYSEEEVLSLSAEALEDLIRLNQETLEPNFLERLIDQLDILTGDTVSGQLATLSCTRDPKRVERYTHSQSQLILKQVIKNPLLSSGNKAFVALRLTGKPETNENTKIPRI